RSPSKYWITGWRTMPSGRLRQPVTLKLFAGWHPRGTSPRPYHGHKFWQQPRSERAEVTSKRAHPGVLEKVGHLAARIEHAGLDRRGGDPDDLCHLLDRLLVVVNEIDDLAVCRGELRKALLHDHVAVLRAHGGLWVI